MSQPARRTLPTPMSTPLPLAAARPAFAGPWTVVLADDHALYREGLAQAIAADPRLRLAGQALDGPGALALLEELEPDVALLDLKMPGLSGLEACHQYARGSTPRPVVLLSAFFDRELVGEAVRAGASGFLPKSATRREICEALVNAAMRGAEAGRTGP